MKIKLKKIILENKIIEDDLFLALKKELEIRNLSIDLKPLAPSLKKDGIIPKDPEKQKELKEKIENDPEFASKFINKMKRVVAMSFIALSLLKIGVELKRVPQAQQVMLDEMSYMKKLGVNKDNALDIYKIIYRSEPDPNKSIESLITQIGLHYHTLSRKERDRFKQEIVGNTQEELKKLGEIPKWIDPENIPPSEMDYARWKYGQPQYDKYGRLVGIDKSNRPPSTGIVDDSPNAPADNPYFRVTK